MDFSNMGGMNGRGTNTVKKTGAETEAEQGNRYRLMSGGER